MIKNKYIKEIHWKDTIPIRHKVLWPDKPVEFCHIENDDDGWHFGCYVNEKLVSVASVYPNEENARLRKFATLEEYQGLGIGTELLSYIILMLKEKGVKRFWCDAREQATGFYGRFGMECEGSRFFKSAVPYFKMSMLISD